MTSRSTPSPASQRVQSPANVRNPAPATEPTTAPVARARSRARLLPCPEWQRDVVKAARHDAVIASDDDELRARTAVSFREQARYRLESLAPKHIEREPHAAPSARRSTFGPGAARSTRLSRARQVERAVAAVVKGQQQHVAAAERDELEDGRVELAQPRRRDEVVDAEPRSGFGAQRDARAPRVVVVERHANLAVAAGDLGESFTRQRDPVGCKVHGERSLRVKPTHERREPAKRPRFAATERDFQHSGRGELGEQRERRLDSPRARRRDVARAERAGQVALIGDAELHDARRDRAQRCGLRSVEEHVLAAVAIEQEQRALHWKRPERHEATIAGTITRTPSSPRLTSMSRANHVRSSSR